MADGSLIIRKKPGIANEKCPTEAQTQVHPEKNLKKSLFLLTLCVTYVTIVNVTGVIVRRLKWERPLKYQKPSGKL